MRRGGGMRGGGFGGSRGSFGGSRSRGSSSGFRSSRTSRRHYGHRSSYYGPRYYGRPHYGRRWYNRGYYGGGYYGGGYYGGGYRSGPTNPAVGIVILGFILLLFVPAVVAGAVTTTSVTTYDLQPGMTSAVKYNSGSKGIITVDVIAGTITTLSFDNEPGLTRSIPRSDTFPVINTTETIPPNEIRSFILFLSRGTTITTTWNFSGPVEYHLVRGQSNFNSWKDGENTQIFENFGQIGNHVFEAGSSESYYFIFWNSGSNTVEMNSVNFDYNLKAHDVTGANSEYQNSTSLNPNEVDGNYLVFYNSGSEDASVIVTIQSKYSFGEVWLITAGLIIFLTFLWARKASSKFKERNSKQSSSPAPKQISQPTIQQVEKPAKSTKYYQRPKPQYCSACGAARLKNSKFCTECGVAF